MSINEKAAFVAAQVALCNAEMQLMLAENTERGCRGEAPAHGGKQWDEFIKRWEPVLGYNALLSFFSI